MPFDIECVRARFPDRRDRLAFVDRLHHDRSQPPRRRRLRVRHRRRSRRTNRRTRPLRPHLAFRARRRPLRLDRVALSVSTEFPARGHAGSRAGATEAILKSTDVACDMRWPNDVMVQSKKCAGILAQTGGHGHHRRHRHQRESRRVSPDDLSAIATSLRIAERPHAFARAAFDRTRDGRRNLLQPARERRPRADLEMFSRASSFVHGRRVFVDQGESTLRGTTAGLNDSGFLILRGDDGKQNVIVAGGVRPCS